MQIPIAKIHPNPDQPRKTFDQVELNELAQSIKEHGLLQPILVQEAEAGYVLIAGERRLRAHQLLGLTKIEAVVRPSANGHSREERSVLALVENLQRRDLAPSEEARAFQELRSQGLGVAAIARQCGVSMPHITSRLALLQLEPEIQELIDTDRMPVDPRVVTALLSVPANARVEFAEKLARPGLKIASVQDAAAKLNAALAADRIGCGDPTVQIAIRKVGSPNLPNWDALHQLKRLPPWSIVVAAARRTCQSCALRQEASPVICKDCPAVILLETLINASHKPVSHN